MSSWALRRGQEPPQKWTAAIGLKQCACKGGRRHPQKHLLRFAVELPAQAEENSETVAPGLEPIQRTPSPLHPTKSTARDPFLVLGFFHLCILPLFNAFPFGARHKNSGIRLTPYNDGGNFFVHEIDAAGRNFREMRSGTGIYRPVIFLNILLPSDRAR